MKIPKPRIRNWNISATQCEGAGISRIGYTIQDAYERWLITFKGQQLSTGHCENKKQPGGCHLHNLQCGYPECDRLKP
jgi:hypothetical protein